MKKVFALLLVFVMLLSAAPVLAEENPRIDSVTLWNHSVSIELANLPPIDNSSIIEVELYSKDKPLTKVRLAEDKLGELAGKTALTCCIPFTGGADAYWPQNPKFNPQRNVVADKAVLYVEGKEPVEKTFVLERTAWNALVPITSDDLYVTNEVKLSREITPKAYENPKDYYLVNSTYGNYVSYTATMDMTKLEGSPLMNELANQAHVGMWDILSNLFSSLYTFNYLSAEVTLTFKFDPMIDLSNYDPAANITLDSNMFKIKNNGIQVSGNTIIINCEFDPALRGNREINPIITLHGKNLPIKSSWTGDSVTLVNQCVFSGKVTKKQDLTTPAPEPSSPPVTYATSDQDVNDDLVGKIIEILHEHGLTIKETTVRDSFTLYIDDPYYPPYNPTPVQPTQPTQPGMLPPQTGDMPLWYAIVHFLGLA